MNKSTSSNIVYNFQKNNDEPIANIVFIHDFSRNSNDHDLLSDQFKKCNYYSVELPGHGITLVDKSKKLSPINIAMQLIDWINSLNLDNIVLIGHSLGSIIAQIINLYISDKINKLILISPLYSKSKFGFLSKQKIKFKDNLELYNYQYNFFKDLKNYYLDGENDFKISEYFDFLNSNYSSLKELLDNLYTSKNKKIIKHCENKNNKKTLIIFGYDDKLINSKLITKTFNDINNIKLVNFSNSNHFPFIEEKELYVSTINEFINE